MCGDLDLFQKCLDQCLENGVTLAILDDDLKSVFDLKLPTYVKEKKACLRKYFISKEALIEAAENSEFQKIKDAVCGYGNLLGGLSLDDKGSTLLHYVAYNSESYILKFLMDQGWNCYVRDDEGDTPLDLAISGENDSNIDLLSPHISSIKSKL